MSDSELNKKPKKKRVLTDEQKEVLKANLKKGRETALKNRQKKALLNKIDKKDEEQAKDEKIAKHVLGKNPIEMEITELKEQIKKSDNEIKKLKSIPEEIIQSEPDTRDNEIKNLKNALKSLMQEKMGMLKKPPKPEPVPEPVPEPAPKPEPAPEPAPPKQKKILGKKKTEYDMLF